MPRFNKCFVTAVSIDESAASVTLTNYLTELPTQELKLIEGAGEELVYNFNEDFTEKKGTRFFKLFYIEVWDEWRMIDSVVLEKSGTLFLAGVSESIKYNCER